MNPFIDSAVTMLFLPALGLFVSIIMHELGHTAYLVYLGARFEPIITLRKFGLIVHSHISDDQKKKLAFWGIMAGFISLMIFVTANYFTIVTLPLYFIGCKKDFKEVFKERFYKA